MFSAELVFRELSSHETGLRQNRIPLVRIVFTAILTSCQVAGEW